MKFGKSEAFFRSVTKWSPKAGLEVVKQLSFFAVIFILISLLSGFLPNDAIFLSPYRNFGGHIIDIVMPNDSTIFAKLLTYPDKPELRTGADFLAAQYLSQALNFRYR